MNMGKLITQLKQALSVPAGSRYIVAMGDGTGTKQVTHEAVVESVRRDLPLGDMGELETENKSDIVGAVNEIVQKLAIVGISYKGVYHSGTEYHFLDAVLYENSTFIAMKNNPEGEPAADGINWQYLAKGFMDGYLVAKSQIVNNLLATEPGNVLDAVQGKALADMIAEINSNFTPEEIPFTNLLAPGSKLYKSGHVYTLFFSMQNVECTNGKTLGRIPYAHVSPNTIYAPIVATGSLSKVTSYLNAGISINHSGDIQICGVTGTGNIMATLVWIK